MCYYSWYICIDITKQSKSRRDWGLMMPVMKGVEIMSIVPLCGTGWWPNRSYRLELKSMGTTSQVSILASMICCPHGCNNAFIMQLSSLCTREKLDYGLLDYGLIQMIFFSIMTYSITLMVFSSNPHLGRTEKVIQNRDDAITSIM